MARSPPSVVFIAAVVFFGLATLNILHRLGPSVLGLWTVTPPHIHVVRDVGDEYLLGVGKGDITGPVVEINFMGYANASQVGTGLRQRIYSRSFIIGDVNNPQDRFIYMVLDTQSGDTAIAIPQALVLT